jgi:hypothetical protein
MLINLLCDGHMGSTDDGDDGDDADSVDNADNDGNMDIADSDDNMGIDGDDDTDNDLQSLSMGIVARIVVFPFPFFIPPLI